MTTPLRLGTRHSALARAQSGLVARALEPLTGRPVELVDVTTRGDVDRSPLTRIGGTGVFVSAVRDALAAGRIDLAVHSLKDLPVAEPDGLVLAALPDRADARDAVVSAGALTLAELDRRAGAGGRAVVGTGSPRRACQLARAYPHLEIRGLRGNVDSRTGRVREGEFDAVVVAAAGLDRLGRGEQATERLDPATVLPAPGQGALAIEVRAGAADAALAEAVGRLDDPVTRCCVTAERAVLAAAGAGCSAPLGALARIEHGELWLRAVYGTDDGTVLARQVREPLDPAPGTSGGAVRTAYDLGWALGRDLVAAAGVAPEPHATPVHDQEAHR